MACNSDYNDLIMVGATHEEAVETLRIINSDLEFTHGHFRCTQDREGQEGTRVAVHPHQAAA